MPGSCRSEHHKICDRAWKEPAGPPSLDQTSEVASALVGGGNTDLEQGAVWLWDVTDPAAPRRFREPLTGPVGEVNSVAFSPGGALLATGERGGAVRLWTMS
jgi:WD40 repeat protein